jgi:hypothetical protein
MKDTNICRAVTSDFIYASSAIMKLFTFRYLGVDISSIPPLAQGYSFFLQDTYKPMEFYRHLATLVHNNKTIVLPHTNASTMDTVSKIYTHYPSVRIISVVKGEPFEIKPDDYFDLRHFNDSTLFLLTEPFILRRFLQQRIQGHNTVFRGQGNLPMQKVHFIGLGPTVEMLTKTMRHSFQQASHVILFDRTFENVIRTIPFSGHLYPLQYIYDDFDSNLLSLNLMLAALHASGIYEVTVLIEGNPEIYDFAEGLSTVGRLFTYEAAIPLVVLSCQWLEEHYNIHFVEPSYILTSGFNARQGITTGELVQEISAYLELDCTCMVMEMYCGDLPLVLSLLQHAPRPKSLFVLTNMFSVDQCVYFLPPYRLPHITWVETIKGRFTTLVIIDHQRLPVGSPAYERLVCELGPRLEA